MALHRTFIDKAFFKAHRNERITKIVTKKFDTILLKKRPKGPLNVQRTNERYSHSRNLTVSSVSNKWKQCSNTLGDYFAIKCMRKEYLSFRRDSLKNSDRLFAKALNLNRNLRISCQDMGFVSAKPIQWSLLNSSNALKKRLLLIDQKMSGKSFAVALYILNNLFSKQKLLNQWIVVCKDGPSTMMFYKRLIALGKNNISIINCYSFTSLGQSLSYRNIKVCSYTKFLAYINSFNYDKENHFHSTGLAILDYGSYDNIDVEAITRSFDHIILTSEKFDNIADIENFGFTKILNSTNQLNDDLRFFSIARQYFFHVNKASKYTYLYQMILLGSFLNKKIIVFTADQNKALRLRRKLEQDLPMIKIFTQDNKSDPNNTITLKEHYEGFNHSKNSCVLILGSDTFNGNLIQDETNKIHELMASDKVNVLINHKMPHTINEYEARISILDNKCNQRDNIVVNLVSLDEEIALTNTLEKFAASLINETLK